MLAATCLLLTIGAAGSASAAAQTTTALDVRVVDKPRYMRGTDGRTHIDYTLALTNDFTADVTLTSLEVLGRRGRSLLRLEGDALATATNQLFSFTPTRTVPASGTVVTIVDIVLPARRRVRARLPDKLRHRVRYELPPDAPFRSIIGSTRVDRPVVGLDRRRPEVVASPLSGGGWIALNACCLQSSHRLILGANGRLDAPETFAIDWTRARDGRVAEGDGSQNSQWYGHGATIRAAAAGRVVTVRNDVPEVAPGTSADDNPTLQGPDDYGGNHVVIRMRPGVYALYGHMIPGSIRVREGQRVGQRRPARSARQHRQYGGATPAFPADGGPRPTHLRRPAIRDQSLQVPGDRRVCSDVLRRHGHWPLTPREQGVSPLEFGQRLLAQGGLVMGRAERPG